MLLSCFACGPAPLGGPWSGEAATGGEDVRGGVGSEAAPAGARLSSPSLLRRLQLARLEGISLATGWPESSVNTATSPGPRILGGVSFPCVLGDIQGHRKSSCTLVGTCCVWSHDCTDPGALGLGEALVCGRWVLGACSSQHPPLALAAFSGPPGSYASPPPPPPSLLRAWLLELQRLELHSAVCILLAV